MQPERHRSLRREEPRLLGHDRQAPREEEGLPVRRLPVFPYGVYQTLDAAERTNAFSTALRFPLAMLQEINALIDEIIGTGETAHTFRERLVDIFLRFGRRVGDVPPHRLMLIFIMETMRAYNAGRYSQIFGKVGMEVGEWWQFVANEDGVRLGPPSDASLQVPVRGGYNL